VIRVTFYNHFQDKYELLEWICREEIINPARILLKSSMRKEAVTFLFTSVRKNKEFYRHVAQTRGQNSFESTMRSLISEMLLEEMAADNPENYKRISAGWLADYYAMSLTYILMGWIGNDMKVPPEEMADIYELITAHSLIDPPEKI